MPRYDCKKDSNSTEITDAFLERGWYVEDTSRVGPNAIPGFPDCLCTKGYAMYLVEIKTKTGKLTKNEKTFRARFSGNYVIVRSAQEVYDLDDEVNNIISRL